MDPTAIGRTCCAVCAQPSEEHAVTQFQGGGYAFFNASACLCFFDINSFDPGFGGSDNVYPLKELIYAVSQHYKKIPVIKAVSVPLAKLKMPELGFSSDVLA